jgi:hypothetical protein
MCQVRMPLGQEDPSAAPGGRQLTEEVPLAQKERFYSDSKARGVESSPASVAVTEHWRPGNL